MKNNQYETANNENIKRSINGIMWQWHESSISNNGWRNIAAKRISEVI
jgi:hypothetical protein